MWSTSHFTGDASVLTKARLNNAPHHLFLRTKWTDGFYESDLIYWLDTRRGNAGPEFKVELTLDEFNSNGARISGIRVWRVQGFVHPEARRVRCGASGWINKAGNVDVTVPRRCLKIGDRLPGAVRLSQKVHFVYGGPDFNGSNAWAPGKRRFGPWVAHN